MASRVTCALRRRPGMVAVIQTFGSSLNWNPHIHAIVTRGVFLVYEPKAGHDADGGEPRDGVEFLARLLLHIPQPHKPLVRFYGVYANRVRSETLADSEPSEPTGGDGDGVTPPRRSLKRRWAQLIYRIYEIDPLACRCGSEMRIVAFITAPTVIRKILNHLDLKLTSPRAPL